MLLAVRHGLRYQQQQSAPAPLLRVLLAALPLNLACTQPITMMRNALGREEGGSGMPLDRAAYEAACSYWAAHAQIL